MNMYNKIKVYNTKRSKIQIHDQTINWAIIDHENFTMCRLLIGNPNQLYIVRY